MSDFQLLQKTPFLGRGWISSASSCLISASSATQPSSQQHPLCLCYRNLVTLEWGRLSPEHAGVLLPARQVSKFSPNTSLPLKPGLHLIHPAFLSPCGNRSPGQRGEDCADLLFEHFEASGVCSRTLDRLRFTFLGIVCGLCSLWDVVSFVIPLGFFFKQG